MDIFYYVIVRENRPFFNPDPPHEEWPQNYFYPVRIFHHTEKSEAEIVAKSWGKGYKLIKVKEYV